MITGAHSIIYSTNPDADRAVLRDVFKLTHVDVGGGWLIFGLPPAEVAVHPSDRNGVHELYMMCDDVEALVAEMKRHNLSCGHGPGPGLGPADATDLAGRRHAGYLSAAPRASGADGPPMNLRDFLTHLSGEPAWSHAGAVTPLTRASNGDTPLHAAIWARDDEAARQLIDAGADVNAAGEDGYTPIHAALAQSNVPLARRLTACGASWNAVNKFACSVRDAARRSDDPAVRALLEQEEVVSSLPGRIGHFRLESGHHSDLWTDLELLCLRPEFVRQRAAELAARLGQYRVDAVCGPLVEGAFVALMVASDLDVEFYYTERFTRQADESLLFPVEYRVPPVLRGRLQGKRVAIVNDVISAGSAVRGTLADLEACGAETVAVAALAVLGSSAAEFATVNELALETLASFPFSMWTPGECPLCRAGVGLQNKPAGNG